MGEVALTAIGSRLGFRLGLRFRSSLAPPPPEQADRVIHRQIKQAKQLHVKQTPRTRVNSQRAAEVCRVRGDYGRLQQTTDSTTLFFCLMIMMIHLLQHYN